MTDAGAADEREVWFCELGEASKVPVWVKNGERYDAVKNTILYKLQRMQDMSKATLHFDDSKLDEADDLSQDVGTKDNPIVIKLPKVSGKDDQQDVLLPCIDQIMKWVPGWNIFYDVFWYGDIEIDDLRKYEEAQGLVCTLLLGTVCSYHGSVEYEELVQAGVRLANCTYFADDELKGWFAAGIDRELVGPYMFHDALQWAESWLFMTLMIVLWSYFSMAGGHKEKWSADGMVKSTTSIHKKEGSKGSTKSIGSNHPYWWWLQCLRFLLVCQTIFLFAGLFYFWMATQLLAVMKQPWPESECGKGQQVKYWRFQKFLVWSTVTLVLCAALPPLLLSFGHGIALHRSALASGDQSESKQSPNDHLEESKASVAPIPSGKE